MKRNILLLLFCCAISMVHAQQTWTIDTKDAKVGVPIQAKLAKEQPYNQSLTSGELLSQSGSFYLYGAGLSIVGSVFAIGNLSDDDGQLQIIGGVMALGGLACTIIGHTKLIKAGKLLDEERKITLHPSSSGIGLAIKF